MNLGHSLPLGSYLLKPVQRILKYHLLLQVRDCLSIVSRIAIVRHSAAGIFSYDNRTRIDSHS